MLFFGISLFLTIQLSRGFDFNHQTPKLEIFDHHTVQTEYKWPPHPFYPSFDWFWLPYWNHSPCQHADSDLAGQNYGTTSRLIDMFPLAASRMVAGVAHWLPYNICVARRVQRWVICVWEATAEHGRQWGRGSSRRRAPWMSAKTSRMWWNMEGMSFRRSLSFDLNSWTKNWSHRWEFACGRFSGPPMPMADLDLRFLARNRLELNGSRLGR